MATNWDKIISGKELAKAKARKSKPFILSKERRGALEDLEKEGWTFVKNYADERFISVKKDKPFYERFEDKVWMLFANMGFTDMNEDSNFRMSYDSHNPNHTRQIDVFAADEETVVIVECKSSEKPTETPFKQKIEAFYGETEGLRKEALKKYKDHKVKFIWATQNCIMSQADVEKLNDWGIALFDEAIIDYYIELEKHLGKSAKYQLLGNLFANTGIKNMDSRIPAIEGKMGNHKYYSFSIKPEHLLKIGYVLHHNKANASLMPAYQRIIKKKRLNEVKAFVNDGGYFPNSIIISIDTNKKGLKFDPSPLKVENSNARIGILHLPQKYRSAYIIDGQHRLYGYSDSKYASSDVIPVVAFIDLDKTEQVKLFMDINENQKSVPKSLRVTLDADTLWVSEDYNERRKALRSRLAQMLGETVTSPLMGRVIIGENEQSEQCCITIDAIQTALGKGRFFSSFEKKNVLVKNGSFDTGDLDTTCDIIYPFIEGCFKFIKSKCSVEWEKGKSDKGILTINRGIHGLIRVIGDIVDMLVAQEKINPRKDKTANILCEVTYYLEPLSEFINNISDEKRDEMRHYLGAGADTKFWRIFQDAIAHEREDFAPDGLKEWIEDASKQYNEDAFKMVDTLHDHIISLTREKLVSFFGKTWNMQGMPKTIVLRLQSESTEQNINNIDSGLDVPDVEPWDCVTIEDIQNIATYGQNWQNIFEPLLADPLTPKGDKKARTQWLSTLHILIRRNRNTYSVTKAEYEWIKKMYDAFIKD